jgi:acetyl-CoA/propionyl-CoA carboxylase biotin carboxyl carrier protein
VRVDGGYELGETVPGAFDSLVAKLIVTGSSREQALQRSRRALAEFEVDGMPTAISFHRVVVDDPAYAGDGSSFGVHTSWIETEFDNQLEPYSGGTEAPDAQERESVVVEVGGKRLEVRLPAGLGAGAGTSAGAGAGRKPARRAGGGGSATAAGSDALTSPMQGTIVKVAVSDGDTVAEGDLVVVLEAMKMEQPLKAHKAGTVTGLAAEVGTGVSAGEVLCTITDAEG